MKKLMTLASAMIMAMAANAQSVETEPFTGTLINVPAQVSFERGEKYAFIVKTSDEEVARQLECKVQNGLLTFNFGKSLKKGEVAYDVKSGAYYYGFDAKESAQLLSTGDDVDYQITIVSPLMPEVQTSSDFEVTDEVLDTESVALNR